jgi:uncharacterized protein
VSGYGRIGMNDMVIRSRLKSDLLGSMKSKDTVAISVLRSLLAALDNASAVPVDVTHVRVFGRTGDVPGKALSAVDCEGILTEELRSRSLAAAEYVRLGRDTEAARLRKEIAVVERYVSSTHS